MFVLMPVRQKQFISLNKVVKPTTARLSLLLDVRTQLENVLLAGRLELVGETEIFDLDLEVKTEAACQCRLITAAAASLLIILL